MPRIPQVEKMSFRNRFQPRRGLRLRPINRIKHVVDIQSALTAGQTEEQSIISSVDAPVQTNVKEVQTGSTVNGIYLKVEVVPTSSAALPNFYLLVAKNPGANLALPNANAVGVNDNKRFVIHQEMVMMQKQTNGNPRTVFNGVIIIPRGYRRFGPQDVLVIRVTSPGVSVDYCVQCHFKEFR